MSTSSRAQSREARAEALADAGLELAHAGRTRAVRHQDDLPGPVESPGLGPVLAPEVTRGLLRGVARLDLHVVGVLPAGLDQYVREGPRGPEKDLPPDADLLRLEALGLDVVEAEELAADLLQEKPQAGLVLGSRGGSLTGAHSR